MQKIAKPLIMSLVIFLFSACNNQEKTENQTTPSKKIIKTLNLKYYTNIDNSIEYPAEIYPFKNIILAFEVSGKIVKFNYNIGDRIKKGSTIALLDDTIIKSNYDSSKTNYLQAKTDYNRFKKLYRLNSIAKIDVERAKQKLQSYKSQYEIAKKNLNNTKLIAEFDGILAQKFVEDYARIVAKQKIALLQDINKFKVKFFVPENDILKFGKIANIKDITKKFNFYVYLDRNKKAHYKANIVDVSTRADSITRTYEATVSIKKPTDINILPGMTAQVVVTQKDKIENAIFIPIVSIFSNSSKKSFVWIIDKDNRVHKKEVKIAKIENSNAQIISGLDKNDKIALSGVNLLEENQEIIEYKKLDN